MNRNTIIILSSVAIFVAGVGFVYLSAQKRIDDAATQMIDEASVTASKIENVTLIPFKADLRLTYSVRNPTDLPIKMDIDADLMYGDVFVGHVVAINQLIQPNVKSDIVVTTKIQGDIGKAISQGSGKTWVIKGIMTFRGSALGVIPVTVTRTGNLFSNVN